MGIKAGVYDSWSIINDTMVIKRTDKSFFVYRGSAIPKELRGFFDAEKLTNASLNQDVVLVFNGSEYIGYLNVDKLDRLRILWRVDLQKKIEECFPRYDRFGGNSFPVAQFTKTGKYRFSMEFVNSEFYRAGDEDIVTVVDVEDCKGRSEGRLKAYYTTLHERNPKNREAAIRIHGVDCKVCGMNFEKKYGELGKNYIEIHHKNPLYLTKENVPINVKTDLVPVCPNCHRMLHRYKNRMLTIEELKEIVKNQG